MFQYKINNITLDFDMIIYISPTGNDYGLGTKDNPIKTYPEAIGRAVDNTAIIFLPGTHTVPYTNASHYYSKVYPGQTLSKTVYKAIYDKGVQITIIGYKKDTIINVPYYHSDNINAVFHMSNSLSKVINCHIKFGGSNLSYFSTRETYSNYYLPVYSPIAQQCNCDFYNCVFEYTGVQYPEAVIGSSCDFYNCYFIMKERLFDSKTIPSSYDSRHYWGNNYISYSGSGGSRCYNCILDRVNTTRHVTPYIYYTTELTTTYAISTEIYDMIDKFMYPALFEYTGVPSAKNIDGTVITRGVFGGPYDWAFEESVKVNITRDNILHIEKETDENVSRVEVFLSFNQLLNKDMHKTCYYNLTPLDLDYESILNSAIKNFEDLTVDLSAKNIQEGISILYIKNKYKEGHTRIQTYAVVNYKGNLFIGKNIITSKAKVLPKEPKYLMYDFYNEMPVDVLDRVRFFGSRDNGITFKEMSKEKKIFSLEDIPNTNELVTIFTTETIKKPISIGYTWI